MPLKMTFWAAGAELVDLRCRRVEGPTARRPFFEHDGLHRDRATDMRLLLLLG